MLDLAKRREGVVAAQTVPSLSEPLGDPAPKLEVSAAVEAETYDERLAEPAQTLAGTPLQAGLATRALPDECLRGLRQSKFKKKHDVIATEAFLPVEGSAARRRAKGHVVVGDEASINWVDDGQALPLLLRDKANAGHGAARLRREDIDRANACRGCENMLFVERDELEKNPYHGNIVFREGLEPRDLNKLAGLLAHFSSFEPPPAGERQK
jgi:hypothetical protein